MIARLLLSACLLFVSCFGYYHYETVSEDNFLSIEFLHLGPARDLDSMVTIPDFAYASKVLLVTNTASKCSFAPQFGGLQKLYEKHFNQGLQILAFPSDGFKQEPKTDREIVEFVEEKYKVQYHVMSKVEVNGPNQHPLFAFLKENARETKIQVPDWNPQHKSGLQKRDIHWNFTKFLVTRSKSTGKLVVRRLSFEVSTDPDGELDELITSLLANPDTDFVVPHLEPPGERDTRYDARFRGEL